MNGNRGQYTSSPLYNMKKNGWQTKLPQPQDGQQAQDQAQAPAQGARRYQWLSLVMSAALPILFLLSLIIPSNPLRWVFLIAAAAAVAVMWALRAFVKSARGTLTVVYTAMAVVVGLALFMNSQSPETRNAAARSAQTGSILTGQTSGSLSDLLTQTVTADPNAAVTPAPETTSAAQMQLDGFFRAWAAKNIPSMLAYCSPSWINQQPSPEEKLWQMLQSSYPIEYTIERMEGSDGNTSRIVTMKVRFSEMSGETLKRLQVVMVKVNDVWYVDPNSLGGVEIDEAAEEAAAQNITTRSNINTTKAPPTPTSNPSSITVYYNEQGGKYYHATATCGAVAEQYWPLTGFSFDLINSAEYSRLVPCPRCNPPERPTIR